MTNYKIPLACLLLLIPVPTVIASLLNSMSETGSFSIFNMSVLGTEAVVLLSAMVIVCVGLFVSSLQKLVVQYKQTFI